MHAWPHSLELELELGLRVDRSELTVPHGLVCPRCCHLSEQLVIGPL
jgi:hypothetical protein